MLRKRSLLVLLASAAALAAGCGGGGVAAGPRIIRVDLPWDKPLRAPATEPATMHWTLGEVTGISLDGATIQVKFTRGTVPHGARVGIYLATPDEPSPHYMWDETREFRAAEAKVTRAVGDGFEAEIVARSANTAVSVGDKVIDLVP
ncbi:MAG: hypothetical protein ACYTKD_26510 [Planctomycetota bacterium]|jgi:hypothetical protein